MTATIEAELAHGGPLQVRLASAAERQALQAELPGLPRLEIDARRLNDLELFANGGFSPLRGFQGEADYRSVVRNLRLANGTPWPIPVTLPVSEEVANSLPARGQVALVFEGKTVGVLDLSERYRYDAAEEARQVYRTEEAAHPGVAALYAQGPVLLAGDVTVLELPAQPFEQYRL